MSHTPVLLNKVLEVLSPEPGSFVIDGTVDGGGHAEKIIKAIGPKGTFLGLDLDNELLEKTRARFKEAKAKVILINDNYANLPNILKDRHLGKANGLLLDLGFSSEQLEDSGRGFSFTRNEPLLMNYKSSGVTAAEVVNGLEEKKLAEIFWLYGEERFSRQIAKHIIEARRHKKIITTFDLVEIIKNAVPKFYEHGRLHPATRVFQALRIYVNQELSNLEEILKNLTNILKPDAVVAIISFHSLEDRLVKNYFKEMDKEGTIKIITKKPIVAEVDEVRLNPRSRSAKLRAGIIKIHKY